MKIKNRRLPDVENSVTPLNNSQKNMDKREVVQYMIVEGRLTCVYVNMSRQIKLIYLYIFDISFMYVFKSFIRKPSSLIKAKETTT